MEVNYNTSVMQTISQSQMQRVEQGLEHKKDVRNQDGVEIFDEYVNSFLLKQMSNVEVDPLFGGGHAEQIFRDFLLDEYAKNITESGGLGLKPYITKTLLQIQETQAR